MTKQKAFTLIEIMVVILIVGALASLILVASKSVRSKTKDAAINASLTHLKKVAELHFNEDYTYSGLCATDNVQKTADSIADKGSQLFCDSDATSVWAACAQTNQDSNKYYCIDNTESIMEIIGTCDNTAIAGGTCISTCPNAVCDPLENCDNCSEDCGVCCGNTICEPLYGEACDICVADCGVCGAVCGDGSCDGGEVCDVCVADCGVCPPVCGDGSCDGGEVCDVCVADCGVCPPVCGDGSCDGGEVCDVCVADCGVCPSGGLISHWKFDGDATDETGSHNGSFGGDAVIEIDPERGQVLSLDGAGDYVSLADSPDFTVNTTDDITYSAWINLSVLPSAYYNIIGDTNGACFQFNSADQLIFYSGSIKVTSGLVWNVGQWYHVAVVVNNTTSIVFYVNGIEVKTVTPNSGQSIKNPDFFWIGGVQGGNEPFNGFLDDVMFYDKALSSTEILQLYNDQGGEVIGYWKFDGDFTDETGINNGGPNGDAIIIVDPTKGQVLNLDGAGDAAIVPDSVSLSPTGTEITLTAWIYCDGATDTDDRIIHKNSSWSLQAGPPCDLLMGMYHGGYTETTSPVSCNLNEWCFITGVYDGINMSTYRNAVFITSLGKAGNMANSAFDLYIGLDEDGASGAFNGKIDDVMIFDRALNINEIEIIHNAQSP